MRAQHDETSPSPNEPKTPPTRKERRRGIQDEESEHDSISVMTPSQPLHDKLDELEQQWSGKRPSRREQQSEDSHYVFAAGGRILHKPSQPRASPPLASEQRTPVRKKKSSTFEIIGSPDHFQPAKKQSVFERLYQQGKESTASRSRRRTVAGQDGRTSRSMPMPTTPQSSSVEGTISTLSSSESIYERLYKGERRKRVDIPRASASRSVASGRDAYQSDAMSAAASLERRLAYAAPVKRRNRVSSSGKVASLIQQHESRKTKSQPGTPRSYSSRSPRTPKSRDDRSVSSNTDSVFERLYRREKRPSPVLPAEKSTVRPVKTKRPLSKQVNSPESRDVPKSPDRKPPSSPSNSVFERLYKGEKRTSPLTADRRRRQENSRRAKQETGRIKRPPPSGNGASVCEEEALLQASLRAADSDDSLLLDTVLPAPTVLSFANASEENQQTMARIQGITGYSAHLGQETHSNDVGDTLARLKLQLYVRRIQRCARAFIAKQRASTSNKGSSVVAQSVICRREGLENDATALIQSLWRGHTSRLVTILSLLQTSQLECHFVGSGGYAEIPLLRLRIQCLAKVVASAGEVSLARMQVSGRRISVDWSKQVVVHFRHNKAERVETAVVSLKCSMRRLSYMKKWSSQSLSTMIVQAVLLEAYKEYTETLVDASVSVIQKWVKTILEKRCVVRRSGRIPFIKTVGLQYLAQYLTPTSLQQRSAITLQNAWRFHQAQVHAADAMLTSWRVKCDFDCAGVDGCVLAMKVSLHALTKAIGRVDCFWITEDVTVGDRLVFVKWTRELGIHFSVKGVPRLESCFVDVDCEASRNAFVEKWGRRKLAILVVKAALNRAIRRDHCRLADTSATLIQTWFRMKKLRIEFMRKVEVCRSIQEFFRVWIGSTYDRRDEPAQSVDVVDKNVSLEESASQSRGVEDANSALFAYDREGAATTIQASAHLFLVRREQLRDRSAFTIQRIVRRQSSRRYAASREAAAVVIQSSLRAFHRRQIADKNERSAETIQKFWRAMSTRDAFLALKRATIVIQTWERRRRCVSRYVAMRQANMSVMKLSAASLIQRLYRGAHVRQQVEEERKHATIIQTAYRRHTASRSFRAVSAGIVALQAAHRGIMARQLIFLWHTLVQRSRLALLVQTLWRGYRVCNHYSSLRAGSILVQSAYRRHYALRCFRDRRARDTLHSQLAAAVRLQTAWRGSMSRAKVASLREMEVLQKTAKEELCAIAIQRWYRCWALRGDFLALRQAAVEIQSFERRRKCFAEYHSLLYGLMHFQALCRGSITRSVSTSNAASAKIIQTVWRGSRHRKQFVTLRTSVLLLQSSFRRLRVLMSFRRIVMLTTSLQALYRGILVRRSLAQQLNAAVKIQAIWKGRRDRYLVALIKQDSRRRDRRKQLAVTNGIVSLQHAVSAWLRRRMAASILIQRCYRRHISYRRFNEMKQSVVQIQATERQRQSRSKYAGFLRGVVYLQACQRGTLTRQLVRAERCQMSETAAVLIQKCWRGTMIRQNYLVLKQIAVRIQTAERRRQCLAKYRRVVHASIHAQAFCRGVLTRHLLLRHSRAAVIIQRYYRGYVLRQSFGTLKSFAVRIQAAVRRRHSLSKYARVLHSLVSLQARQRGALTRQLLLAQKNESTERAAVLIQRWCRSYSIRQSFLTLKQASIRLQTAVRRWMYLSKYTLLLHGIVNVQATFRGFAARQALERRAASEESAALLLQRWWRSYSTRQSFLALKQASIRIQTGVRQWMYLSKYTLLLCGVVHLQATFRGFAARQALERRAASEDSAALLLQRWWRSYSTRQSFLALKQASIRIQTGVRQWMYLSKYTLLLCGVVHLQATFRGFAARQVLERRAASEESAALLLQRWWRSYYIRQSFLALKQTVIRIQAAGRRRICLSTYTLFLHGIVHVQASYRGFSARQALAKRATSEESAALLLQSHWRKFCSQRRYSAMNRLAVRLQAQYRGALIRQLLTELAAAVIMQSYCRSIVPRKNLCVAKRAAVLIQAWTRRHHCLLRYTCTKRGVLLLQTLYRGVLVRQEVRLRRWAAVQIQAKWRASCDYDQYCVVQTGVLAMQRTFRCLRAQKKTRRLRKGMVLLQAMQRGVSARRNLQEQGRSAVSIQKAWEQYHLRSSSMPVPLVSSSEDDVHIDTSDRQPSPIMVPDPTHLPAVAIQSWVRCFLVRRCLERMHESARLIQAKYFTWKMQLTLLMVQSSVVLLQRSVRGQLLRSAARFALSHINASLRSSVIGSFGRVSRRSTSGVASIWRAWTEAVHSAEEAACIVIQSAARRMLASLYSEELRMDQPTFRKFVSRNAASAFMSIKSMSSGMSAKGQGKSVGPSVDSQVHTYADDFNVTDPPLHELPPNVEVEQEMRLDESDSVLVIQDGRDDSMAALQLQKAYRRRMETTKYRRYRTAVVCLQSRFRGTRVRLSMTSMTLAAIRLQQEWRMRRECRRYKAILKLTVLVQSMYRMRLVSRTCESRREAIFVMQTRFRAWLQGAHVRKDLSVVTRAAIRIQQMWRALRERRRYEAAQRLALVIQSRHRMRLVHRSFHMQSEAAHIIQHRVRAWQQGNIVRMDASSKNLASLRLQQVWRIYRERRHYQLIRKAALKLQATYRMRCVTRSFCNQKDAALALQTAFRVWSCRKAHLIKITAAITLQATVRQFLAQKGIQRTMCAAVSIQRVWRGTALRERNANHDDTSEKNDDVILDDSVNIPMEDPLSSTLDGTKACERMGGLIVSEVDTRSRCEVDRLLQENAACSESDGICIRRLVRRVVNAQKQSMEAAAYVKKQEESTRSSTICAVPPNNLDDHSIETAVAASCVERADFSEEVADTMLEEERCSDNSSDIDTDVRSGTNEAPKAESTIHHETEAPSGTLDLATQAQQLLLEARRARVKFQNARPQQRTPLQRNAPPFASPAQPVADAQQVETQMFGQCVQDDELPSPIKPEEEEWDWANDWN
jgi:myosin heavy subunit